MGGGWCSGFICDPARRFQAEVAKNENLVIACIRKANS